MSRLVVATTFPVDPPRSGGQARVHGLYGALAGLGVEVDIVSLADPGTPPEPRDILPGLRETRIAKTDEHGAAEGRVEAAAGVPATDIALGLHHELTPGYAEALARIGEGADGIVACHPYAIDAIEAAGVGPLIYEAQDVEYDLKAQMLDETPAGRDLVERVGAFERACCERAEHVIVCAERDGRRLHALYDLPGDRTVVVPNGVDPARVPFTPTPARRALKRALGRDDVFAAMFTGAWHEPNIRAVEDIILTAAEVPDVAFIIIGSVGMRFQDLSVPSNVDFCGVVSVGFLQSVLRVADAAMNPMRSGSGTNLKMLEYLLAGVPVISSSFGARGLDLQAGIHYHEAEPGDLAQALVQLRQASPDTIADRVSHTAAVVRERFAWPTIARGWLESSALRRIVGVPA